MTRWVNCPRLVLHQDVLLYFQRERQQFRALKILLVHVNRIDAAVVVGLIVIYSFVSIHARRIYRNFIFLPQAAAAPLLLNGAKNMKELANASSLVLGPDGIEFRAGRAYEA